MKGIQGRKELLIQGSNDIEWIDYKFRNKPSKQTYFPIIGIPRIDLKVMRIQIHQ